jgi:hypothetical protein
MTLRSTGARTPIPSFAEPQERWNREQEREFRRDLERTLFDITERSGPRQSGELGVVDVKLDFGLLGDGSDETAAFQEAIDDIGSNRNGGTILVPGDFTVSHASQITLRANVAIVGSGYSSRITYTGTTALAAQQGQLNADQLNRIVLRNVRIDGDGQQNLVSFHGSTHCIVEGCWLEQLAQTGVNVAVVGIYDDGGSSAGTSGPYLVRGNFTTPVDNFVLAQGRSSGPHTIQDIVVADNIIDGANNDNVNGAIKIDLEIERVLVSGNLIEGADNINDGVNVQENLRRVSVVNNIIRDCRRNGVLAEDGQSGGVVQELLIANNNIEGIGGAGASERGINLNISNGGSMRNVNVAANIIRNCVGQGIAENTGGVVRNVIAGNIVDECGGGDNGQIQVRGTDVLVVDNYVTHSSTGGASDDRSFAVLGSGTAWVMNNVFLATDDTSPVNDTGTGTYRNNRGFVTENNGTATVASGTTSIAVTHGLTNQTPALDDIQVTPTNNLGSAALFWISAPTSTQFTINVDVDPGATTATFAWSVNTFR